MALQPSNRTGNIFPVHIDLRQRVGTQNLLRWCLEAPQAVEGDAAQLLRHACSFRPQMMLTLLTFCYSTGYYGSEDIERAIRSDKTARYICARIYPDANVIRRFRRHYRAAIDQCLAYVLYQAAFHMSETNQLIWSDLEHQVLSATQEKIELAVIMDRFVAEG